jgi:hypothetical protein
MAGKTDNPAKKQRSKFFRVAVEGATTDGRQIERQWLVDAAEADAIIAALITYMSARYAEVFATIQLYSQGAV